MKHSSSLPLPSGSPNGVKRQSMVQATHRTSLPAPPAMNGNGVKVGAASVASSSSALAQNMAASMTIEEMRQLHRRAQTQAEAKQTELRLVLASRYRELVGSSDEVTKMRERANELHQLVHALPGVMAKVIDAGSAAARREETKSDEQDHTKPVRRLLAELPRTVHLCLDRQDVYGATMSLVELFTVIAQHTDEYPMATALATSKSSTFKKEEMDDQLKTQLRMTFLYVQTLPSKIIRMSRDILLAAASYDESAENQDNTVVTIHPSEGTKTSAAALSTLHFLDSASSGGDPAVTLLDAYFDSKATLLQSLLNKLYTSDANASGSPKGGATGTGANSESANNAEAILSKIVLILQYDIILNPYQIFVLRKIPGDSDLSVPIDVPPALIKAKTSKFLSAHVPLIRTKVQSILVDIAGTTASALGKIRQSLYDKTDGVECKQRLDTLAEYYNKHNTIVGSSVSGSDLWDDAVSAMVDPVVISSDSSSGGVDSAPAETFNGSEESNQRPSSRKFSLWGALFSNTFSSLVHSLLSTAFHSVHTQVAQTLRSSLANAPPLSMLLPHEAHRNTLFLASQLDTALLRVSDDAHELLVHAEERVESERRLRQSLYVQTCEIMGRMLCELRRMLSKTNAGGLVLESVYSDDVDGAKAANATDNADAVKQLIVGRLCYLLKFRLTALPRLLDPESSPAALQGSGGGMISFLELSSAFELADDNDDGLITFKEAMEAADSAFSGTPFHGAEMIRETLLLSNGGDAGALDTNATNSSNGGGAPSSFGSPLAKAKMILPDVTLHELTLLSARGLRHDSAGAHSALGTIQSSLDNIIASCFEQWGTVSISPATKLLQSHVEDAHEAASAMNEAEYQHLFGGIEPSPIHAEPSTPIVNNISPYVVTFLLDVASNLNRSVCPSDSLPPVPSLEYARSMGIVDDSTKSLEAIPTMMSMIRKSLLTQSFGSIAKTMSTQQSESLQTYCASALLQLHNDLQFIGACYFERNQYGMDDDAKVRSMWDQLSSAVGSLANKHATTALESEMSAKRDRATESCDLFLSSLFGRDPTSSSIPSSSFALSADLTLTSKTNNASSSLLHAPLPSTCRFSLLPVQSDRTLADIQMRSKYKDREAAAAAAAATAAPTTSRAERVGNVMSSGLGFFNSILKNKN